MSAIPSNVIFMWHSTHASIPTNWTEETSIADRFIKGHGAENPGVTGGATAHSHTGIAHSHTVNGTHGHSTSFQQQNNAATFGGTGSFDSITSNPHNHPTTTITTITGGTANDTIAYPTVTDNNAPTHARLIFIKAGVGAVFNVGMIGLWNTVTPPVGWYHCNGSNSTPDLRNIFPRAVSSGGNANITIVGDDTHTHVLNHSHSTIHSHSDQSAQDDNHPTQENSGGGGGNKTNSHTHTVNLANTNVTTDTYIATLTSSAIEPPFKKLLAVRRNSGATNPKGLIGIWLGSIATIPVGWKACTGQVWEDGVTYTPDMQNYYVKFANTTAEIGNTTQAGITVSLTHNHPASNSHSHTESAAHSHSGSTGSFGGTGPSGGRTSIASHAHSVTGVGNNNATMNWNASTMSAESVSNEPQYIRAAFIQLTMSKGGLLSIF